VIDGEKEASWESDATRRFRGDLRFEDIHFHYPSRPGMEVLAGISFDVKAGEQVALVGSSGSGKSTLASLLLGLYAPVSGKLLIDAEDTAGMPLHERRSNMALVPQEVILFGGTIYDNIRYGKPDADAAAIESAARQANAHDFIVSFPEGYQTMVGDRGIRLSGGQKQRIAIARAILRNPSILILDEATSSLDTASEQQVQTALDYLMQGRTSLVIAHRLSTIRNADRILVLDQGRIAEAGNHEVLMAKPDGLYRKMYELQEQD
jgi:ABC-type multidrug transport system fused ATPase/permease subunit